MKCVAFSSRIYFWGSGQYENEVSKFYDCQMYAFDTATNRFEVVDARGDVPVGRFGHSMFVYDGKIFVFGGWNRRGVNAEETCERMKKSASYLNQFFCFHIDARTWRRCKPFGTAFNISHKYHSSSFEVIGSLAFLFGGMSVAFNSQNEWFILDLELTLKNFCIQELLKNKDFNISKLPPGLRRNFMQ